MKKTVAATILKCAICGFQQELPTERYNIMNPDTNIQIHMIVREAQHNIESSRVPNVHFCNGDRMYGFFQFAGVKIYNTVEE
jgi:hypothetical protein